VDKVRWNFIRETSVYVCIHFFHGINLNFVSSYAYYYTCRCFILMSCLKLYNSLQAYRLYIILELKARCCNHKMCSSPCPLDWWTTGLRNAAQSLILSIYNSSSRCITCSRLNYSILAKTWILLYSFAVVCLLTRYCLCLPVHLCVL